MKTLLKLFLSRELSRAVIASAALAGVAFTSPAAGAASLKFSAPSAVMALGKTVTVQGRPEIVPDSQPVAVESAKPRYPNRALDRSREGWVVVEMDIDAHGRPDNLSIVASEGGRMFDRSALRAMSKFRFVPAIYDGNPVPVTGKRYKLVYALADR